MRPNLRRSIPTLLLATALSIGAVVAAPRPAEAEVIERIVAIVNEQAIFLSELRRRASPFLPQVMTAGSEAERIARLDQLYSELLGRLVEEELFRQAASRMGVRVTQDDIDRAIKNMQAQSGLADDQFWEAVRGQGFTEAQYRQDLRAQLLRLKVLNQRVRGRVNITEDEVRRRYDQLLRDANRKLRFRASHCFFAVEPSAGATEVAQVRARAEKARAGLTQDAFEGCIGTHGGGDLGWLSQGDLPEELEQTLLTLGPGEIGQPVRGPAGYHVFLVHERERGDANLPTFERAKEELFRQMLDRAMARQEQLFLDELRRDASIKTRL